MVHRATPILIALAIVSVASACSTGADEAPSASEVVLATPTPTPTPTSDPVAAVLAQCADAEEPEEPEEPVVLILGASSDGFDADRLEGPRHCEPFTIILSSTRGSAEHMVAIEPMDQIGVQVFKGELIGKSESTTYEIPPLPAGEYRFVCNPHRQFMQGTLVVAPSG